MCLCNTETVLVKLTLSPIISILNNVNNMAVLLEIYGTYTELTVIMSEVFSIRYIGSCV